MPRSIKRKSFLPRRKVSEGMPSSAASRRDTQPKAEKAEITSRMIEAGSNAYSRWDSRVEEVEGLVAEIFVAMTEADAAKR